MSLFTTVIGMTSAAAVLAAVLSMMFGGSSNRDQSTAQSGSTSGESTNEAFTAAKIALTIGLVFYTTLLYFGLPAFTGVFWGKWLMLLGIIANVVASVLLVPLVASGRLSLALGLLISIPLAFVLSNGAPFLALLLGNWLGMVAVIFVLSSALLAASGAARKVVALCAVLTVAGWAWYGLTYVWNRYNTGAVRALAALAKVEVVKDTKLPPTDFNVLVQMTPKSAYNLAQQKLGSTGDDLGSTFTTMEEDYTRQSINGHLYYCAPLVYAHYANQFGILGKYFDCSPGFVSVDAQDPNGKVTVHTDKPIRYMPAAFLNRNLQRHVYLQGYMEGTLHDQTFEVDDNWNPHFTFTYIKPAFTVIGKIIDKVLVVNGYTGEIVAYDEGKSPEWVDRVMSYELVEEYANWYGKWRRKDISWPNLGNQGQDHPAEIELVNSRAHKPIFVVPMTSMNGSNTSAVGVLVCDSQRNSWKYYENIKGFSVGENVDHAFQGSPENLRKLPVASRQLHSIEGVLTYVAIYTQPHGEHGESFAAIGLVPAENPNGANVVMASDKASALNRYINWISSLGNNTSGDVPDEAQATKITGTVVRIGWIAGSQGRDVTFYLKVTGDPHILQAAPSAFHALPLVREGDPVAVTYHEISKGNAVVKEFSCTAPQLK